MTSITINDVDEQLKRRLQERATRRGKTLEAEALGILREALSGEPGLPPANLYTAIRAIAEPVGGIELDVPLRQPVRELPRFE